MIALVTLFVVVLASLIVTRIATKVLMLTGLAAESARFQARSALTGVGFTTSEAESVVNHPIRRKVVMMLMLLGSAGVITAIATLMLSFVNAGGRQTAVRGVTLIAGLLVVLLIARSPLLDRALSRLIERALARFTHLDVYDYASLLHLSGDFTVTEVFAGDGSWIADRRLRQLDLREEGIRVLGIVRVDGTYVGAPIGETVVHLGDTMIVYGHRRDVADLATRRAGAVGDALHERAVEAHRLERASEHTDAAPDART